MPLKRPVANNFNISSFLRRPQCIPNCGITGEIRTPTYLPHQFDVTSVPDMVKVWIELCSIRPMKVGEK